MKRIAMLLLALSLGANVQAQSSQRQKMIHMAAMRIADRIQVGESEKDTFIELYQTYKKESAEIMKIRPSEGNGPEEAAEMKILSDFEKSGKILSLRKSYYFKFRAILSPSQIQKMYDAERAMSSGGH